MSKACKTCLEEKELSEFHNYQKGVDGKYIHCKLCTKELDGRTRDDKKNYILTKTYGISVEEYKGMLIHQGGVCKICSQPETQIRYGNLIALAVDHDHESGKVRGLLCSDCNRALGLFRDSTEVLERAVKYLRG